VVVVDPFRAYTNEAALSPRVAKVRRSTSTCCASTSWRAIILASSSSLLFTVPFGCLAVMRQAWTDESNLRRHTIRRAPGMNHTLPMPCPLASTEPIPAGSSAMISSTQVGRLCRSVANAAKSVSCWRMGRVMRLQFLADR
jgi:hypothetical protein